ncbi:MAG: BNR-4 repeat-containing protein [Candidatus Hydrogenedentes bacterium]|nr:BNR-4 repeat-containing protein [Candidatus Hydrogenedentota bacterium]
MITRLTAMLFLLSGISSAGMVDYFTDNGYGNPVAVIQHPCAEYYNRVTYIAYQGPHEDPYVCAYDHAAKKWSGPVQAGENPMGKTPDPVDPKGPDNHGRPAMIVDGNGYIHLVFGGHGGYFRLGKNTLGAAGNGKQTHVVSKNPQDISAWEVLDNISPFGTYSQFVKMDDGDIYLFYRHGSHQSDWVYQKSTDNCRTFSPPVSVLKHKTQQSDPNIHDAWYAWFENGKGDTITASYVYHLCRTNGHTRERYNGYYMKMNCGDESWENAGGNKLVLPVTKEYADQNTLVCDTYTAKEKSNHGTCRVDDDGNPHLFFRRQGQVHYFRWLGNAWQKPVAVPGGDGDMIVESPKVVRMLLTGGGEVCWWRTTDGGLTWAKGSCLISSPDSTYTASTLVRNAHPDGRMVVNENNPAQNHLYRKLYLLGDSGPIGRPEEEASNLGDRLKDLESVQPASKPGKPVKKGRNKLGEEIDSDE